MKKRIKEIAEQVWGDTSGKPWSDSAIAHLEKFAELVAHQETHECAKHYLEIMRTAIEEAVLKEREACVKLLEDFSKTNMVPAKDTWRMGLIAGANAIRARSDT